MRLEAGDTQADFVKIQREYSIPIVKPIQYARERFSRDQTRRSSRWGGAGWGAGAAGRGGAGRSKRLSFSTPTYTGDHDEIHIESNISSQTIAD